ncbi:Hsp20/alpha crystallin family protein [Chamaesiphon sp. VAR_48_metabat_135_sub]|uniref:Hsp20/alpha crystallin family protein n=1 Tax=Chamaesiphon sp. VAR_48_metabat_135_sub TaxID=2964699 RepID=UPI00286A91F5|nr:Hsp20/alpha crystallin family protein [Chamaesiphon sp. VAR_48_metabat_135_sub]
MTLVRWQPLHNITTLQREMDRLFENLAEGDDRWLSTTFVPAAEMHTDTDNVYLQLEVPGLTPEEIEIQVNPAYVVIKGERQESNQSEERDSKRSEFRYGAFHRTISFPEKVQQDRVRAKYEHGILKLTLPKAEDDKNKTVKVVVAA